MSESDGPRIKPGPHPVALLNLFRIDPDRQHAFLALQLEQTRRFRVHRPGFISSAFHRSLDGTRLLNFAFWECAEDVAAARSSDAFQGHLGRLDAFDYDNDMHLYEIRAVRDDGRPPQIAVDDGLVVSAAFFDTSASDGLQAPARLTDRLNAHLGTRWPRRLRSAVVLAGLDGESLAVYLQWHRGAPSTEADAPGLADLGIDPIVPGAVLVDEHVYEVVDVARAKPGPAR